MTEPNHWSANITAAPQAYVDAVADVLRDQQMIRRALARIEARYPSGVLSAALADVRHDLTRLGNAMYANRNEMNTIEVILVDPNNKENTP